MEIIVHEPVLEESEFEGFRVVNGLASFKSTSDVIVANRLSDEIKDVRDKVYTRGLFSRD